MSLRMKINSVPFDLGGSVESHALDAAYFQAPGGLRRLLNVLPTGQTIYTVENCKVECFSEGFSLYPCTHGYLNKDRQWQTKASLYLEGGRVQKLEFQVIEGHYAAANFLDRFQQACSQVLGEPVETSKYISRWENGQAVVTSVLHSDMVNVDFMLEVISSS